MIQSIIDTLNTRLSLTNLFEKNYGLVELITDANGVVTPKEYCTSGEYKSVTNFDKWDGLSYFRKDGSVTSSESTSGSVSCDKFLNIQIPFLLVVAVPRKKMEDNTYTPDSVASIITKQLWQTSRTLKTTLTARRVNISVPSYSTDTNAVFNQEFNNVASKGMSSKYAYLSLSVRVEVDIKADCIVNECDEVSDCTNLLNSLTTSEKLTCILPSYDFADQNVLDNLTAQQELDLIAALCTCADGTVYVKDSAGTTLHTVTVTSGGTANQTITDSTVTAKNSANTTLGSTTVKAENTANISISDITYTDALGSASSVAAGVNITATRVNAMTCAELNGELIDSQRQVIQRVNTLKTGQTTSYRTGDDGNLQNGRLVNFYTLSCNNGFGNTNRFTDDVGGQTYTNNLVCDWATGIMWYRTLQSGAWNTAIDAAQASTQGGYSDWFLSNNSQILSILDYSLTVPLSYTAFGIGGTLGASIVFLWQSSTTSIDTTKAWLLRANFTVTSSVGWLTADLKTNSYNYIYCRYFTLSDLGL